MESLWSSLQDEVYFMGSGVAGNLWRHQQWSPSWPPSWILKRIRNWVKAVRNGNFLCFTWKITQISALHDFSHTISFYCWKKLIKTCTFTQKWLDHLLLMTSYLVTIATDNHWTRVRGMNEQLLKTPGADVLSSRKKLRKTLWGGGGGVGIPPPCTSG